MSYLISHKTSLNYKVIDCNEHTIGELQEIYEFYIDKRYYHLEVIHG